MNLHDKEEAIKKLIDIQKWKDTEAAHSAAEQVLLDLINDPAITEAWNAIEIKRGYEPT